MNFDGNFRLIGQVNIEEIKMLVQALTPQHWLADKSRQQRYTVHQQTQAIPLVYDLDFRHIRPTQHPALAMFGDAIRPILVKIADYFDNTSIGKQMEALYGKGYCIRANLVSLLANCEIKPHQDKNFSLAHSHRLHIPIITNKHVLFQVGGETQSLVEGDIVEINNRREHSVVNRSDQARVHLIIDWVIPNEPCCCADKTHPNQMCNPTVCEATDRMRTPCHCFPIHEAI